MRLAESGETVVVSGAAGATGSVVGMIAKIKGSRVVGIGRPREMPMAHEEAGFDGAFDYKNENVGEALTRRCPKGVDTYFDNVGGEIAGAARVPRTRGVVRRDLAIQRSSGSREYPPKNYFNLLLQNARMEGFLVFHYAQEFPQRSRTFRSGWPRAGSSTRSISPKASRTRRRRSPACSRAPTSASSS
jgi:NADPH-dependent curcumin reductase